MSDRTRPDEFMMALSIASSTTADPLWGLTVILTEIAQRVVMESADITDPQTNPTASATCPTIAVTRQKSEETSH